MLTGAIGAVGYAAMRVHESDTAKALASGELLVLGTPRVLALAEAACVAALTDWLEDGETSVGVAAQLEHLAACGIGAEIRAVANCVDVAERRAWFECNVFEGADRLIASVNVERVVVDGVRFMTRLAAADVLKDS
jgi:fluoroacetyl-CoA thioesterase